MGNTTDNDEVKYEYDAAGREVKIEATAKNRTEPIYDGDGQVLALPKFIWQTTTSSYPSTPGQNTLLIRSSVLGGKVVSEALGPGTGVTTAAGSMSRSRVIADGTEVATLKVGFGGASNAVLWPMIDPAQSSYRDTNGSGAVPNDPEAMAERDPAGANVQTENPYDSSNPGLLPPVGSSSLFSFSVTPMDQRVLLNVDNFVTPNSVSVDGIPMSLADIKTNWGYALIGNQFDLLRLRAFNDWIVRYDDPQPIEPTHEYDAELVSVFHFWQANSEGLGAEPGRPVISRNLEKGPDTARTALGVQSCAALFGDVTKFGFKDPLDLLNTYLTNGLIKIGSSYPTAQGNEKFESAGVGAVTSLNRGAYTNANGTRVNASIITVNSGGFYFTGKDEDGKVLSMQQDKGFRGLNLDQIQGAVLIHELLHAIGQFPNDDPQVLKDNGKQSRLNSEKVRKDCFPGH